MLKELTIHNLAIIDDLTLRFSSGLNIISGETGAGKSVIIGALGLLLGLRASNDILRSGSEKGSVTGAFEIDSSLQQKLFQFSIPDVEDGMLVLSREIFREGKNLCRINEKIYTLSSFRAVGTLLIDIYGQNEERGLLLPGNQLEILDQLGGASLLEWATLTAQYSKQLMSLDKEIASLEKQQQELQERTDFLLFQHNELQAAQLTDINEEQVLEEEIRILSAGESLAQKSMEIYAILFGSEETGGPVYDKIGRSISVLEEMAATDPSLGEKVSQMNDVLYSVADMSEFFRGYAESIESNPQKLEMLRDRMDLIKKLKAKYKRSIGELMAYREEIAGTLESQGISEQRIEELKQERNTVVSQYREAAGKLSQLRQKTGKYLAEHVTEILKELEMGNARFEVEFSPVEGFSEFGAEEVAFVFSANKGEPLKPLQKVASGGELSRLMLALKSVLADVESVPVMVFDEADAGVGGEAAGKVGLRIAQLAAAHQVICVTHSAQVAVFADEHFVIAKKIVADRTVAQVEQLSMEARTLEIARMIGGKELETAMMHAEKLLEGADKQKTLI